MGRSLAAPDRHADRRAPYPRLPCPRFKPPPPLGGGAHAV